MHRMQPSPADARAHIDAAALITEEDTGDELDWKTHGTTCRSHRFHHSKIEYSKVSTAAPAADTLPTVEQTAASIRHKRKGQDGKADRLAQERKRFQHQLESLR